ncbi:MAG: OmpA family protein [Gammaproteobacteria bacterium]|nr:OmpA family protein [Gammaproteobacteria bacterium]MDH3767363.1 OmpA family protein [Gammaproteobacteria bacterium]
MNTKIIAAAAVVVFAVFSFFCLRGNAPAMAADLTTKSTGTLAAAGMNAVSVGVNGRDVSLTGIVPTVDHKARAEELVSDIRGVRTVSNELQVGGASAPVAVAAASAAPVAVTPYEFRITKTPDAVTLKGLVPDNATRRQLLDQANRAFGSSQIQDEIELAPGAPSDWSRALTAVQSELSGYVQGDAYLSDQNVQVRGLVPADRDAATARLAAAIPEQYRADIELQAPAGQSVSDCQTELNTLLANNRINFAVNSASISSGSYALLDRLANVVRGCSSARIQILGHTDSQGAPDANAALSQRRAQSVVAYLIAAGIAGDQLVAEGFGETQPIGSNETREGRALNRRIEFNVLGIEK